MENDWDFIRKFVAIGAIKIGEYTLKKNVASPIYVDLRNIISYPDLLRELSQKVWDKMKSSEILTDALCGVPYTALPIATTVCILNSVPLLMKRKEAKDYGTKKAIEGSFKKGQRCLIVEDVVTSGSSVIETAKVLRSEGLVVTDCVAIIDRQQGGKANLEKHNVKLHSLFELKNIVSVLADMKFVSQEETQNILSFLNGTQFDSDVTEGCPKMNVPFLRRADSCIHPVLKRLFTIMHQKQTNLCVSMDVVKSSELFQFAEVLGPHVCMIKTNIDILGNYSSYINRSLRDLATKYNFLILEDRKFADIGNTTLKQYEEGLFRIKEWADIVTVHSIPGDHIIEGMKLSSSYDRACILIAQVSCDDSLITDTYLTDTVSMAKRHKDFVIGFLSQTKVSNDTDFIHISPAVSLVTDDDPFGEVYKTPEEAIKKDGADIIIVGKAITRSKNILESVSEYKKIAYKAYLETVLHD